MATLRDIYDERIQEFRENYGFYEQDEAIRSLSIIGEILDHLFIGDEAGMTMAILEKVIAKGVRKDWHWAKLDQVKPDKNWRETWSNIDGWDASSCPPFLDDLHELSAFADFGVITLWDIHSNDQYEGDKNKRLREQLNTAKNLPTFIEGICERIDAFEKLTVRSGAKSPDWFYLPALRDKAIARLKLDQNKHLTIAELSTLSGVTVKRLQNAVYAQSEGAPTVSKSGLISPDACARWLNDRDYIWSIWQEILKEHPLSPSWGSENDFIPSSNSEEHDDYVFVPVANDGSLFSPALLRGNKNNKGFKIGPKGTEETIPDFETALKRLSRMRTPYWRRPNRENGNWGIVSGQSWKRIRTKELKGLRHA